jgi:FkbM family methyltransferase
VEFTSYAQNFEDVLLWRCFGNLKNGFYVDVGAGDPSIDSVTKCFYENGWTGVNIEPTESAFMQLEQQRPRDINLRIAVAEQAGTIDFWVIPSTGLSTAVKKFAERHENAGLVVNKSLVQTQSLKKICEEYIDVPIHFMKIDVEGFELEVLRSADFARFRPMVILVESTEPNSQVECQSDWEDILLNNDYLFCYADGLNRFYLSKESEYMKNCFKYPPNVFDKFQISSTSLFYNPNIIDPELDKSKDFLLNANRELVTSIEQLQTLRDDLTQQRDDLTQQRDDLTQQRDDLTQQRDDLSQQRDDLSQQRDDLSQQRDALLNSTIWKTTKPLRSFIRYFKRES